MDLKFHRMMPVLVLLLYLTCYLIQMVSSQSHASMIIRSPVNQSTCAGGTVNFTCVVMFTSGSLGPATWFTNDGNTDATAEPGHTRSFDSNGRSAPANVTTVLTVTNVSISDNGADYVCTQGLNARSDTVFLTVLGLPSSAPIITVTPLSNTSFTVNWTISDPNYSYTVIWTNINTGVADSITVPENTNSYTVTGLSVNDNYKVSVAIVGVCGMMTSDLIIVYSGSTIPPPQFDYCISYNDGQPTLQVISHVIVTPRSSLSLTFSASYQTGNSNSQSATCSLLSDMQYNCTAEFAVDIIPSVNTIESVNVTVSGPYGSALSLMNVSQGVNAILSVGETEITENSVKLISKLPCFSPNLQCALSNFILNSMDVNVTNNTGETTGSLMAYSYPTQTITVTGLNSGATYNYCIVATDITNMMVVGEQVCGNFTTQIITGAIRSNDSEEQYSYIAIIPAVVIVIIIVVIILLYLRRNRRRFSKADKTVLSKLSVSNQQIVVNETYDDTSSVETGMQGNEGTIKDDIHPYQAEEASKAQLEQQSRASAVNHDQNKMPARSNEESMATKSIRDEGYALPSPKSSRASKQIDNTTPVNKTKYTELDVLPSPTSDDHDTKPLIN